MIFIGFANLLIMGETIARMTTESHICFLFSRQQEFQRISRNRETMAWKLRRYPQGRRTSFWLWLRKLDSGILVTDDFREWRGEGQEETQSNARHQKSCVGICHSSCRGKIIRRCWCKLDVQEQVCMLWTAGFEFERLAGTVSGASSGAGWTLPRREQLFLTMCILPYFFCFVVSVC
jgi:hypothetical protein